ncbi:holo-ACP synthase [Streptomyces sp. NPDC058701]|uniref:holo-ACP synthase n=1 Tax=Streptomyces sp. NPDC058701 TaxID=3346608 RepID=UPI0036655A39
MDLVPLSRVAALLTPRSGPAIERMLTVEERELCAGDATGTAGRLAAKEAVFKLFGSSGAPLPWHSIEILREPGGRPLLRLTGRAAHLAEQAGLGPIDVSISHDGGWAVAVAVALAAAPSTPPAPTPPTTTPPSTPPTDGGETP